MKINNKITFNKETHDPFIDALKGFSILFVIINHALPLYLKQDVFYNLWGGLGVPIFLLLQTYHYFKRGLNNLKPFNTIAFVKKMLVPYIFAELVIVLIKGLWEKDIIGVLKFAFLNGGVGPGNHYIWIFLQFVILLPLCAKLFTKLKGIWVPLVMILFSEALEILCSYIQPDPRIYNFLFFRYFFLIYLGYTWAVEGIFINYKRFLLSIFSIVCILVLEYGNTNFSPFIFDTVRKTNHWVCYFYVAFLFPFILKWVYESTGKVIKRILEFCGKESWCIFCTQIIVFELLHPGMFTFIQSVLLRNLLYFVSAILLSLIPAIVLSHIKKIRKK